MISGTLIGSRELVAKMTAYGPEAKADMDATVDRLGFELQAIVQRDYLTGQALRARTGRLRASIGRADPETRSHFESTPITSTAVVGTNVSYGRTWEYDGLPARDIVPVRAKALRFEIDGAVLFRKRAHIPAQPARPFLMPALLGFKPSAIEQMRQSLRRTAERVFK
jgi:phage gpG-like protein